MKWIKTHWPLLLLLIGACALYIPTLDAHGMFMWDEAEYALLARGIAKGWGYTMSEGGGPHLLRPPILPAAGAVVMLVTGQDSDAVIKISVLFFALLGISGVYWTLTKLYDQMTGLAAAALVAVAPSYWEHASFFLSEIPFIALFFIGCASFLVGLFRDSRYFYVSWVSISLSMMTRYTGLFFGPIAVIFTVLGFLLGGKDVRGRILSKPFWFAPFAGLAVQLPWLIRMWVNFGSPLAGFERASGQLVNYMPSVSMPWHYYWQNTPDMVSWLCAALAILGTVRLVWKRDLAGLMLLVPFVFTYFWMGAYRYKEVRLVTAAIPFIAALGGIGLAGVLMSRVGKAYRTLAFIVLFLFVFVFTNRSHKARIEGTVALGYPSFTNAMEWVRSNASDGAKLMADTGPQTRWYADMPTIRFPREKADLESRLDDVEWAVITNFERGQKPYVLPLANLFSQSDVQAGRIRLYQGGRFTTVLVRADALKTKL